MNGHQYLFDQLVSVPYNFKLKESEELAFHVGCDFYRHSTSTLCMNPRNYIIIVEESYIQNFKR